MALGHPDSLVRASAAPRSGVTAPGFHPSILDSEGAILVPDDADPLVGRLPPFGSDARRIAVTGPNPDDLIETAERCTAALHPLRGRDWDVPAGDLDWTCRETLEHVCGLAYAPVLATRATSFRPLALTVATGAPLDALLRTMEVMSRILAEVARAAPASARAYHPAGASDPSGFVAMGMDELLVHTADIATGLRATFTPDDRLVRLVLDRLFPWWPRDEDPWLALLWANGRGDLPGRPSLGAAWVWHCAPLDEWDGRIPRWDPEAGRLGEPL